VVRGLGLASRTGYDPHGVTLSRTKGATVSLKKQAPNARHPKIDKTPAHDLPCTSPPPQDEGKPEPQALEAPTVAKTRDF